MEFQNPSKANQLALALLCLLHFFLIWLYGIILQEFHKEKGYKMNIPGDCC